MHRRIIIPFKSISRLLPFPTQIVAGFTYNHLRSMYAYDIKTPTRVISEKDTLCGRESSKIASTSCVSNWRKLCLPKFRSPRRTKSSSQGGYSDNARKLLKTNVLRRRVNDSSQRQPRVASE